MARAAASNRSTEDAARLQQTLGSRAPRVVGFKPAMEVQT
jgi:hypothetical protein